MPKIRLIHPDTDLSDVEMFKYDWDVMIRGVPYQVYNIPEFVHSIGYPRGDNTLWVCPRSEEPTSSNLIPYVGSGVCWGISVAEHNSVRHTFSNVEVKNHYEVIITRNGATFYSFGTTDMSWGWAKAYYLLNGIIREGAINFNSYNYEHELVGRHIWYRGKPYTTVWYIRGQACVMAVPGHIQVDNNLRGDTDGSIKIDILDDGRLDWYDPNQGGEE